MQDQSLSNNIELRFRVTLGKIVAVAGLVLLASCGGGGSTSSASTTTTASSSTYTIGGTVSGLAAGASIVLQNNGADNRTVSANGPFTFATALSNASAYSTSILALPANQPCTSTYGAGTVNGANVTNVNVFCGPAFVGTFSAAGSLATQRYNHTATLLTNGKVLITGGYPAILSTTIAIVSAELYDPATNTWSAAGSLAAARGIHTATLLPNGKVLVTGGSPTVSGNTTIASAELYDPSTNTWAGAGSFTTARFAHTATLLPNGKVLVAGGVNSAGGILASTELYDPATNTWSAAGSLRTARAGHTATLLPNGKVLVAAGASTSGAPLASAELYDPATNSWSATTGGLAIARYNHTATLLSNGKVLVAGGDLGGSWATAIASVELFDPATNMWSAASSLVTARTNHTATLLPNGKILLAGGWPTNNNIALASTELYDPATNTWSAAGSLATARAGHTATILVNGKLLAAGGNGGVGSSLASAELYW